jgi:hypothetical protein
MSREHLAVVCELLFPGVSGDLREEARYASIILGPEDAPELLGFLLT